MKTTQLVDKVEELQNRLIFLLQDVSPHRGRYAYLQKVTGLSANRWQNLFLKRLPPSMDMVFAALHLKPQYAEWVMFGSVENEEIQRAPEPERWEKFKELRENTASTPSAM